MQPYCGWYIMRFKRFSWRCVGFAQASACFWVFVFKAQFSLFYAWESSKKAMAKNRYKKLSEHYLEDFRYFLEHPIEYEVFQEEYLYVKRVGIRSKDSFSIGGNLLFTPDVDAVSFLQLSSGEPKLFSRLLAAGIKSGLIQHFSECEEAGRAYTDPETGFILWKRVPVPDTTRLPGKEEKCIIQPPRTLYSLGGVFETFHRVLAIDKGFLPGLLRGFSKGLCDPYRLDLCIDLSYDIMGYVTQAIAKGHYESFHRHPYGFGWLGGRRIKGSVGKYSKLFRSFSEEQLCLDTVYFGSPKRSNYVIIFYDKQTERKEREKARWPNKSRVEIRVFGRDLESKEQILNVLKTYVSDEPGWEARTEIFTSILYQNVKFTINKRNRNKHINPIAPWWRSLLGTLAHPVLKLKKLKKGGSWDAYSLLVSENLKELHKEVFPTLRGADGLLIQPLRLEAGDLVLDNAKKKGGRAARVKKDEKVLKVSHFDRVSEIALESSKKAEYKQFRAFYRKYNLNRYLSKEEINEIKGRFWGTRKRVKKGS